MVRPAQFGFNTQTAGSNSFQQSGSHSDDHSLALSEFDQVVKVIQSAGIDVFVYSSGDVDAPDAIFPNNWFSTHSDGRLVLYPMMAPNRRRESSQEIIRWIRSHCGTLITDDIRSCAERSRFLEGTGSIVMDHRAHIAYAVESPRTNIPLLKELCTRIGYRPFVFHCMDAGRNPVYHTNVVLCMGDGCAAVYADGIPEQERRALLQQLKSVGRTPVLLRRDQMEAFCGNMLLLRSKSGLLKMLLSATSWNVLEEDQKAILFDTADPVIVEIPTIERIGGGSIRCMLAELYINRSGNET